MKRKISEEKRQELRQQAAEKRRALLQAEKNLDLLQRSEMLAAAGEIRTTDGARLSEKNTLLVAMQAAAVGVSPSLVGGFKQWREQGRHVRKGARGLLICFPKVGKNEETGGDEVRGFGWGYVFDISQTCEGSEAAEAAAETAAEVEQEQEQAAEATEACEDRPAEHVEGVPEVVKAEAVEAVEAATNKTDTATAAAGGDNDAMAAIMAAIAAA